VLNVPIVHSVECRSSLYDVRRILPFNLYHCLLQGHRRLPIVPGMVKGIDLPLVWCCKLYNWYPWVPGKKVTLGVPLTLVRHYCCLVHVETFPHCCHPGTHPSQTKQSHTVARGLATNLWQQQGVQPRDKSGATITTPPATVLCPIASVAPI